MAVQKQLDMPREGFLFFQYVLEMLRNWEKSPFGSAFKQDLNMLPNSRKREEHIQSFEAVRQLNVKEDEYVYLFFWVYILEDADKTWTRTGESFPAHVERKFREFLGSSAVSAIEQRWQLEQRIFSFINDLDKCFQVNFEIT